MKLITIAERLISTDLQTFEENSKLIKNDSDQINLEVCLQTIYTPINIKELDLFFQTENSSTTHLDNKKRIIESFGTFISYQEGILSKIKSEYSKETNFRTEYNLAAKNLFKKIQTYHNILSKGEKGLFLRIDSINQQRKELKINSKKIQELFNYYKEYKTKEIFG